MCSALVVSKSYAHARHVVLNHFLPGWENLVQPPDGFGIGLLVMTMFHRPAQPLRQETSSSSTLQGPNRPTLCPHNIIMWV